MPARLLTLDSQTGKIVADRSKVYVAVPKRDDSPAEIRVFAAER